MQETFYDANAFNQNIDRWDVSKVTDMSHAFLRARAFNQSLNSWDVSRVTDMRSMFLFADSFNQNLSDWNVSSVTDMSAMFSGTQAFNQDIGGWDVSRARRMIQMFEGAEAFNQNIAGWDVSSATDMSNMFRDARAFNQNIDDWNVSAVNNIQDMFRGATSFNHAVCWPSLSSDVCCVPNIDANDGEGYFDACCKEHHNFRECSVDLIEFAEDTYVRGGSHSGDNFRANSVMHVKTTANGSGDHDRKVIFEFDFTGGRNIKWFTDAVLSSAKFKILIFNDLNPEIGYDDLRAEVLTNTDISSITWDTATVDGTFVKRLPDTWLASMWSLLPSPLWTMRLPTIWTRSFSSCMNRLRTIAT